MKERQRWSAEEDALLCTYVKQYGPHEWNLVAHRMNASFHRDAKSCLERWKNYLSPSVKKGSLSEEEQLLVIALQAKHGNKWRKIAAEVPGRTAKRLSKWWEVFKDKQRRRLIGDTVGPIEPKKYDHILENFAEKLMATPTFPPWLSNSQPPPPSVALTLSSSVPTLAYEQSPPSLSYELAECCRELEEGHQALVAHKKETSWRLRRVELQLESEKACRRRKKMEEIEAKIRALREEQMMALDRIEAEYREQILCLRRDAEMKEQKLAEQWAASHIRMSKFLEQMQCHQRPGVDMNGH